MKKIAIITGASSGIGKAFARIIDRKEVFLDEIWLIGKTKSKLEKIAKELDHDTRIIDLDLTSSINLNTIRKLIARQKNFEITVLVNSAGIGVDGCFEDANYINIRSLLRLNIEAFTSIAYNCMPHMNAGARIINMASAASYLPQPYFSVYAASKSYVLSFTRALREELKKKDIIVSAVCPGPVNTNFFDNLKGAEKNLEFIGKANPMRVAYNAYQENLKGRGVITYGLQMKAFRVLSKVVPHSVLLPTYTGLINAINKCKKTGRESKVN